MEINPIKLEGKWNEGWALDLHTISSHPVHDDDGIIIRWDTKRPPIAEELYRLKYWKEKWRIESIAIPASNFLRHYIDKWQIDLIVPIPPSDITREFQPVEEIAKLIGKQVNLPVNNKLIQKVKSTTQLKTINDPQQRRAILKDAFKIEFNSLMGKDILVFDDLYRSGETLSAVCDVLLNKGNAKGVYILTITKTRSKR